MPAFKRPTVYILGALVTTFVGVLGVKNAQSRTPMQNDVAVACFDRVKELESEVRALREQLRVQSERLGSSGSTTAHSNMSPAAGRRSSRTLVESCAPPFSYDDHGIKNFKPSCLGSDDHNSCATPYEYTSSGIKLYKPNCLEQSSSVTVCDPPFEYDTQGVKTFKPACL